MSGKIVYLMRGLPSCGKSYTARQVAGQRGLVCETDEFFHTQIGKDPDKYNYDNKLRDVSRQWNYERFMKAVDAGVTPIVVDRGNSLSLESQRYARYAVERGYAVKLKEPDSPWWQEIRVLLKYRDYTKAILDAWAERLAAMSRSTHRVPAPTIRRRMEKWKWDLTVEEVLRYKPPQVEGHAAARPREAAGMVKAERSRGTAGEVRQQSRDGQPSSAIPTSPWVGEFLLNLAGAESTASPNKDIRVTVHREGEDR